MTRAQTLALAFAPCFPLIARLRHHLARIAAAHDAQAHRAALSHEILTDTALPPEDLLGQADTSALPFFFQRRAEG